MELSSKIVMGAILLLLGAILVGVYATEEQKLRATTTVGNDTLSLVGARLSGGNIDTSAILQLSKGTTNADLSGCAISNFLMYNASGTLLGTGNYSLTTTTGKLTLANDRAINSSTANYTTVSYTYCPDSYIRSDWANSVNNVTVGMLAIVVLAGAIGIFYSVYREVKG